MSAASVLPRIKQDLTLCYSFPEVIDALPEEVFYSVEQSLKEDPLLSECRSALTLTRGSFVLKIRHKKSKEQIGIYFDRRKIRFRMPRDAKPKHFEKIMQALQNDEDLSMLIDILQKKHKEYALVINS